MSADHDGSFSSLFLGPKGENAHILADLLHQVVMDHAGRRWSFHTEDGPFIQPAAISNPNYQRWLERLRQHTTELLGRLNSSIPWWNPRYLAHMNTDVQLPAVIGYVAAMIDNPNNVVRESAPPTTEMEIEAVDALLDLVGFCPRRKPRPDLPTGWGHFCSGGTVANFEALWVARNVRYFALALRHVAQYHTANVEITLPNGVKRRLYTEKHDSEDAWQLLNLSYRETLGLRGELIKALIRVGELRPAAEKTVDEGFFRKYGASAGGLWGEWTAGHQGVVLAGGPRHYSWLKATELLGIGRGRLVTVPVDSAFRINVRALRRLLIELETRHLPVIALVANMGTTEEAAVDPLHDILELRNEMASTSGMWFPVHVDAAFGGYVRTVFRSADGQPISRGRVLQQVGYNWPPEAVFRAQEALPLAESITIDPHKMGYVPYPCGAVLFSDERVRDVIASKAPYLWHKSEESDANAKETSYAFLGPYTLEGTRPGAAAAAAWLAQKVIPLNADGHGQMFAGSVCNARALHLALQEMGPVSAGEHQVDVLPLCPPDLSIVCFVVNVRGNDRLATMNALNQAVARRFAPYKDAQNPYQNCQDYFVSETSFGYAEYGESLIELLFGRAKIRPEDYHEEAPEPSVTVLRMTVMHPWSLVGDGGGSPDFIQGFCQALRGFLVDFVPQFMVSEQVAAH